MNMFKAMKSITLGGTGLQLQIMGYQHLIPV